MISKGFLSFILSFYFVATACAFTQPISVPATFATKKCSSKLFSSPAVVEKPETVEKIRVEDKKTEKSEGVGHEEWCVRLWNDPFNKREFVARCLSEVCGKSDTESFQIMMQAHKNGMGVIGLYNFEIAEMYNKSLKENGLSVDMIPVEDQ